MKCSTSRAEYRIHYVEAILMLTPTCKWRGIHDSLIRKLGERNGTTTHTFTGASN